jgi:hypothetical protein
MFFNQGFPNERDFPCWNLGYLLFSGFRARGQFAPEVKAANEKINK